MLENLSQLEKHEKELLILAPELVAALIGGADGEFTEDEIERAAEIIHIKTFSEKHEHIREIYELLDHEGTQTDFVTLMVSLPTDTKERCTLLENKLSELNAIFPKLKYEFTSRYYKSLRQVAHLVANADGGFWGMGSVRQAEEKYIKLPMINEPVKA